MGRAIRPDQATHAEDNDGPRAGRSECCGGALGAGPAHVEIVKEDDTSPGGLAVRELGHGEGPAVRLHVPHGSLRALQEVGGPVCPVEVGGQQCAEPHDRGQRRTAGAMSRGHRENDVGTTSDETDDTGGVLGEEGAQDLAKDAPEVPASLHDG
jgi:hypothetical protein